MLVLSRRLNEKIVFPGFDATVRVLDIRRGVVRLGIEAPPEVAVLREEVQNRAAEWQADEALVPKPTPAPAAAPLTQQVCDRLKATGMGMGLVHLLLDAGHIKEAKAALTQLEDAFRLLRFGIEGELEPAPQTPVAPPRKMLRALLVEDDRNERELLAGYLRKSGLEVDTAGDGAAALDYLRLRGRPDVVLMDMGLPRVDGPTTVREIRRDPTCAGLKIFGVSGHLPDEFDLEFGPAGVDRWFHKPLDPSTLLQDLTHEVCDV